MWFLVVVLVLTINLNLASYSIGHHDGAHTNGSSGDPCPMKKCLAGRARCIKGKCVCKHPFVLLRNNGHFACYRTNELCAEIKNDPTIRNFNNEVSNFPFPCRYEVTSTTTDLRINGHVHGSCKCQLYSWNSKNIGKLYVGGFDMSCFITNTHLYETLGFSVRKEGIAENGHYQYIEHASNYYSPDGPWISGPLHAVGAGISVHCNYDPVNNQAVVDIPECGYRVTFVAYDVIKRRNQDQVPGLSVAINTKHNPVFHDNDEVMATAPPRYGGKTYRELTISPLTTQESLLIRASQIHEEQNQPNAAAECKDLHHYMAFCNNESLPSVGTECFWMLDEPRLSRCMNNETDTNSLILLLEFCIVHNCLGDPSCSGFVDIVNQTNCGNVTGIPQLEHIVSGHYCTP